MWQQLYPMFDRASEQVYITEINTIPGSLAFYLWDNKGVKYSHLSGVEDGFCSVLVYNIRKASFSLNSRSR